VKADNGRYAFDTQLGMFGSNEDICGVLCENGDTDEFGLLEIDVEGCCPEQGVKLLGLLLTGSTGQHMAGRNGLA
jgi:hypothetical protein